jgi:uncharacterized coiled-coil DUF342 family protein
MSDYMGYKTKFEKQIEETIEKLKELRDSAQEFIDEDYSSYTDYYMSRVKDIRNKTNDFRDKLQEFLKD